MSREIMQRWLETVDYRISEGSDFGWSCFGFYAYRLDHWNGDSQESPSFGITFDRQDQTVYHLEAHDYVNDRAYRWENPDFSQRYSDEAKQRGVSADQAWDDVNYIGLDSLDDFFEKARAIYLGEDYDTRVTIPVEFTDEELLKYMTLAHEQDITFNQFIEEALRRAIDEYKRDPEGSLQRAQRWKDEKGIL